MSKQYEQTVGILGVGAALVSALVGVFLGVVHEQQRLKALADLEFKVAIFQRFPAVTLERAVAQQLQLQHTRT